MLQARNSFGPPYDCKYDWNCGVQCGSKGITVKDLDAALEGDLSKRNISYTTAFFEAFPRNPDTFIRGEGKTIEEAEENAWQELQGYLACSEHEWEPRNYTNGAAFCKKCNLFGSKMWGINTVCSICSHPTTYSTASDGKIYCESCLEYHPDIEKEWLIKWNIKHFKEKPEVLAKQRREAITLYKTYQEREKNETKSNHKL
jgi:hypothetical protein